MVGQIPTEMDGQYLLHPLWFVFLFMGDTGRHTIASESNVIILVSGFEQFSIECRKQPGFYWFCCTTPCDWSNETLANLSTTTDAELTPKRDSALPFSRPFACFYFEFSLASCSIFLHGDWSLRLLYRVSCNGLNRQNRAQPRLCYLLNKCYWVKD